MDYRKKDQVKFNICNKLLSRGVKGSSSFEYGQKGLPMINIKPDMVNMGSYKATDIVGISVNGNRKNAKLVNISQLKKIMEAGSLIVKDNSIHTARKHNTGERHLEKMLSKHGYIMSINDKCRSIWRPAPKSITIHTIKSSEKTTRMNYGKDLCLNATVKSGVKLFTPTWAMVMSIKNGSITQREYTKLYLEKMRESFKANHKAWKALLNFESITIACYCVKDRFCHRVLLAEMIAKFAIKNGLDCRIRGEK